MAEKYEAKKNPPLDAPFSAAMIARKFDTVDWQWANIKVEQRRKKNDRSLSRGMYFTDGSWLF